METLLWRSRQAETTECRKKNGLDLPGISNVTLPVLSMRKDYGARRGSHDGSEQ